MHAFAEIPKNILLNLNAKHGLHFNIVMLLSWLKQNTKSIFNMRIRDML